MTTLAVRALLVVGALPLGWYAFSLMWDMSAADKCSIAVWVIGGLLAHDAVFAPLCIAAGHGARRVLPRRWWGPILAASSATVVLLLLAFPVAAPRSSSTRAPGDAQSQTLLDRPYGLGIVLATLVIWALAITVIARRRCDGPSPVSPGRRPGASASGPSQLPGNSPSADG